MQNNTVMIGKLIILNVFLCLITSNSCNIYENNETKKLHLLKKGMSEKEIFVLLGKPYTFNTHCDSISNNCTKIYYYQAPFIYSEALRIILKKEPKKDIYYFDFYDFKG